MPRTKPRLFAFPREVELAHLQHGIADPRIDGLLTSVVDAFATIARCKAVTPDLLQPFEDAVRCPDPEVRGLGLLRLSVLCHYFPEAVELYATLSRDPDPELRQFAVRVLANTPPEVISALLPVALADPDWSVRKAAATVAGALPLPTLRPIFEDRLGAEVDARVRVVLQLAVEHQAGL